MSMRPGVTDGSATPRRAAGSVDRRVLAGTVLADRFRLVCLLAEPPSGLVYAADEVASGVRVAVLLLEPYVRSAATPLDRLRTDAMAASSFDRDGIAQCFDVSDDPIHGLFLVMEPLEGESLPARLARDGALDLQAVGALTGPIAAALDAAHRADVVHGSFSPACVFIASSAKGERATILDLGVARFVEQERRAAGATSDRPARYLAPEHAQGLESIDRRTDVWGVGCVLYEMLAGKSPFEEQASRDLTLVRILTTHPPSIDSIVASVPRAIAAMVDEAISHERADRPADCATLAARLTETTRASLVELRPSMLPTAPAHVPAVVRESARVAPISTHDIDVYPSTEPIFQANAASSKLRQRGTFVVVALCLGASALVGLWLGGHRRSSNVSRAAAPSVASIATPAYALPVAVPVATPSPASAEQPTPIVETITSAIPSSASGSPSPLSAPAASKAVLVAPPSRGLPDAPLSAAKPSPHAAAVAAPSASSPFGGVGISTEY